MRLQNSIIVLLWAFVGCSSSELVTPTGRDGNLSFEELNDRIRTKEVTISFRDDSRTHGEEFQVDHDSASWRESKGDGLFFKVPVSRIHTVSTGPNRLVGGLIGFGTGVLAGGIVGWQVAQGMKSSGESGDIGRGLLAGAAVGAGGGALVGTISGVAIGRQSVYDFGSNSSGKIDSSIEKDREGFLMSVGIGSGLISTNSHRDIQSEIRFPLCFDFRIGDVSSGGVAMYWNTAGSYYNSNSYGGVLTQHGFGVTYFMKRRAPSLYFSGGVGAALWVLEGNDGLEGALGYDLSGGIGYEFSPHWSVDGMMSSSNGLTGNYYYVQTTSMLFRFTLSYLAY